MRILITGGAGFIGSWLAEKLLEQGHEIFIIDNLSTGNRDNIKHLLNNSKIHFEHEDILNESKLEELIKQCDFTYHLAAAVGVKTIMEEPLKSFDTNVKGTELVLELAHKHNKPTLIASSSEVYGKNPNIPFSENSDRVYGSIYNYRWGYALSKTVDEFIALAYHREKNMPVAVVRFFNTVGPRQSASYGMVIPNFINQCLQNQPITIHGDGTQTRCFTHVKDVVSGLVNALDNKKIFGQVINLGSEQEVSILDLAEKIKTATDSNSDIKLIPYEKVYGEGFEDMKRRVPDISLANKVLNYQPQYNLDQIIAEGIEYYKNE